MEISAEKLRLYAVIDCAKLNGPALERAAEELLSGGVTCLELEVEGEGFSPEDFAAQAQAVRPLCQRFQAPLLIRNNPSVAQLSGADGVRLDWSAAGVAEARSLLGPAKFIGSSAHDVKEAILAQRQGADFLVCGSVFGSSAQTDAVVALERPELWRICKAAGMPVIAAGGITPQNAPLLIATGIVGIAVSRSLFYAPNKLIAAHELRGLAERICAYQEEPPIINYRRRNR